MVTRDRIEDRRYTSTAPDDARDPFRFGTMLETTKDVLVLELRRFFDQSRVSAELKTEAVNIDKFQAGFGNNLDPYETAVTIVRKFPDIDEALPHIAVVATSGTHRPLGFGAFLAHVQYPPQVTSARTVGYSVTAGDTLTVRTKPNHVDWVESVFRFYRSTDSLSDIVAQIQQQALYVSPRIHDGRLVLEVGGALRLTTPNAIEIVSGSTGILDNLGFVASQSDTSDNPLRPPMNRYGYAWDLSIRIEVITNEETTRGELADLVMSFFSFFLEKRQFTFVGRSIYEPDLFAQEHWVVMLSPSQVRSSGETEVPRPDDGKDRVYLNSFDIGVLTTLYLDRAVLVPPNYIDPFWIKSENIVRDENLPMPT